MVAALLSGILMPVVFGLIGVAVGWGLRDAELRKTGH
jgi:hypothetical protein